MSNELKVTGGEWMQHIDVVSLDRVVYSEVNGIEETICVVDGDNENNANLLAASKGLYNALKELYEADYTSGTHLYTARLKAFSTLQKASPNYKP